MAFDARAVEELVSAHGEPEWLRGRRRDALTVYERLGLPSKADEEWRRTDLKALNLDAFAPHEHPNGSSTLPREVGGVPGAAGGAGSAGVAAVLRQRGSEPGRTELDPELSRRGVLFMPLSQAVKEHPELVKPRLFTTVRPDRDKFTALQGAFFSGGTFLYVPPGVLIEQPLVGQFWSGTGGAAVLPHTLVVVGEGASVNYVDEFLSPTLDQPALTSGSAEVFAGPGSSVGYVSLQRWGRHAWQFADQHVTVEREASARLISVGLGGAFAKTRVSAELVGPGASAELKGIYFGSGEQFFDFHTLQRHQVGQTTSDLLFKGALRDSARSVYAGLIRIEKNAQRSDAYQANRNLLLSKTANASSIPMLEIENNDVRCTHGATVAPVDPQHLFYLESRGIPPDTALRMLVLGFFGEVLDRIPVAQARELVEQELEARIG
jgi:Fe-S cluster assembly protein SufD